MTEVLSSCTSAHPDPLFDSVVRLFLDFGDAGQAVGSAFLVNGRHGRFIATAFHNLSGGISPFDRFHLDFPPRPLSIDVWYGGVRLGRFPTYAGGRSLFSVHPDREMRKQCDVAIIDYALLEANADAGLPRRFLEAKGVNEQSSDATHGYVQDMFLPAGRDALILGFPGGRDFAGRPIAVCCKLAAPPEAEMPYLLVSGPTYSGCSGAVAFARDYGGYFAETRSGLARAMRDHPVVDQWLGLYSGRLTSLRREEAEAPRTTQIGVVWTAGIIQEIGDHGVPDVLS